MAKKNPFIPRGRFSVEMGDADNDGRVDLRGTLELAGMKLSTPAINIGLDNAIQLLGRLFDAVKHAGRRGGEI